MEKMKDKEEEKLEVFIVAPWWSLLIGAGITIVASILAGLFGWLMVIIIRAVIKPPYSPVLYGAPLALTILTIILVGLAGLKERIKVAHKGVLLFLGKRVKRWLFDEGRHWTPALIASLEEVDTRKIAKDISKAEAFTKENVRVSVDTTIQYIVKDPYTYLELGPQVVEKGLEDLTKQVLRLVTKQKTLDQALEMHQELNDILRSVLTPGKETGEDVRKKYGITQEIDKSTAKWGIDVVDVFVAEVQPPEEVSKELEKVRKEIAHREAEEIETAHIINMLNKLQGEEIEISEEKSGVGGGVKVKIKKPLTPEASALLFQTERGKVTKNVDEKRIVVPEESGQLLKEIAANFKPITIIVGKETASKNEGRD